MPTAARDASLLAAMFALRIQRNGGTPRTGRPRMEAMGRPATVQGCPGPKTRHTGAALGLLHTHSSIPRPQKHRTTNNGSPRRAALISTTHKWRTHAHSNTHLAATLRPPQASTHHNVLYTARWALRENACCWRHLITPVGRSRCRRQNTAPRASAALRLQRPRQRAPEAPLRIIPTLKHVARRALQARGGDDLTIQLCEAGSGADLRMRARSIAQGRAHARMNAPRKRGR